MITEECINCGACVPECPNQAISRRGPIHVIDPECCTECVGFHDYEACQAVCPIECCVPDPDNLEDEPTLYPAGDARSGSIKRVAAAVGEGAASRPAQ